MAESLDDSGPLQQLEDVSFDSCDDLEVSMSELTLDYDDDDDQPRSSTPISERSPARTLEDSPIGGKHHLTPSKQDVLPKPKRFHVGVNPSGREVAERRANLELLLREGFELREGYESSVQCVLSYLGFEYQKQSLVSRAVKEVFPGVYTKRETKSGHKQTYYVNLALKCSIAQLSSEHEASSLNGHTTVRMMQRLMANIDIFGSTRKSYHSTDAFNVHPTTKHHEQDPFPDQLKATNFILRSRFLKPNPERKTVEKFMDPKKASISISNVDAYEAGKKKVLENFNRKLFSLYGIMNEVEMNECEDEGLRSDSE